MSSIRKVTIWDKGGKEHTDDTLKIALESAKERHIDTIIVSTSTGYTGERAVEIFKDSGLKLVFVTHQTGYRASGIQSLSAETREKLEKYGKVVTCTDVLTGGVAVGMGRQKPEKNQPQDGVLPFIIPPVNVIIANTLRLFSQGVKVCAEVAMMAVDSNAVPPNKTVICVAGSHAGADTAMVVTPVESNRIKDLKMNEILVKPY
ncbi:hypothetical protein JW865_04495 [Candidatus Bathyarchaeota archaeon]|nr:hypothetical protein [Candidatus Bathyarchaeota archaeon]